MAVIGDRETFLARVREVIGESTDDRSISFLEDMSDTYDDFTARVGEDWRRRYEENDANWRARYAARFSGDIKPEADTNVSAGSAEAPSNPDDDRAELVTIEDILYN